MPGDTAAPPPLHSLSLTDGLSPDALEALTELAAILGRLRPPQSTTTLSGAPANGSGTATNNAAAAATTTAGAATATAAVTGTTPRPASSSAATVATAAVVALKDVPAATDDLKHKLQRARAQVAALPDMAHTAAEQAAEVRALEARLAAQRDVLRRLRGVGDRERAGQPTEEVAASAEGEGEEKLVAETGADRMDVDT